MTPLVGREDDLTTIVAHFVARGTRLLTLTGPGGVGKTRLAIAAVEACHDHFQGRTWFVPVVAVTDPALVLGEVSRLIAPGSGGSVEPLDSIARAIGFDSALVVIDNFEQVMAAASELLALLQTIPSLHLLMTSREALRLRTERVHLVAPLEFGGGARAGVETELSEAGRFFVASAVASNAGFVVRVADTSTINQICQRLDGLPLAIELAAARTRILPPANLLNRLDEPLRLLVRGPRDLPERQQTMRNTIAWSFDLLSPEEQDLFCLLSVFAESASWRSLEEVWPLWSGGNAETDLLVLLESLIGKSLVTSPADASQDSRYRMLETLREFGVDILTSQHRLDDAREMHANWFLVLGESSVPNLSGATRSLWLDTLEGELGNIRAVMEWVLTRHDATLGLRCIEAFWRFWESKGHMSEGERFSARVLLLPSDGTDPALRAAALYGAAMMPYRLGDYDVAWERAEASLAMARTIDHPDAIARGLNGCALIAFERGDFARSERAHLESLERSERLGLLARVSTTGVNLGILYYEDSRYDDAWRVYQRSLEINTAPDRAYDRAFALNGLGIVSHRRGDLQQAQEHLNAAIDIRRADRDSGALAASLTNLAMVNIDTRELAEATALLKESVKMRWSREEMRGLNEAFAGLARIAGITGQHLISAELIGTIDYLTRRGHRLPRPVATELETTRLRVANVLERDQFESAVATGRTRSLQAAVDYSLEISVEMPPPASVQVPSAHPLLSPRELDVLRLIAEGKSDRQIAETLAISRNTVIRHVANIFLKLEINSRTVAAMYALNHGIVPKRP